MALDNLWKRNIVVVKHAPSHHHGLLHNLPAAPQRHCGCSPAPARPRPLGAHAHPCREGGGGSALQEKCATRDIGTRGTNRTESCSVLRGSAPRPMRGPKKKGGLRPWLLPTPTPSPSDLSAPPHSVLCAGAAQRAAVGAEEKE